MSTEKYIEKVTLGSLETNQPIKILEYTPEWAALFQAEAATIKAVLSEQVLQLEHVGSTSVPGLSAKPIIDMLLVVADSADEAAYVVPLEQQGYSLRIREPEWFEHRLLKGPGSAINLHVFSRGCPEIQEMLNFRDWLRLNHEDRQRYQELKQTLAKRQWQYVQDYADSKTPMITEIKQRANAYFSKK